MPIECAVNEASSGALIAGLFLDPVRFTIRDFGKESGESEALADQHRDGSNHN